MKVETAGGNELYEYDDDPNQELIGFRYTTAQGTPAQEEVTVKGTALWSHGQYVVVQFDNGHETIKQAGIVMQIKESVGR